MPRSICRCGWRKPTGAPHVMPASSMPCLRRVDAEALATQAGDVSRDTPEWLLKRWSKTYGAETARAIAAANGHEPALDLTVKSDAESWAERLRGRVLPTGTVRTLAHGAISLLPGFSEGAWWVQDAAAALPARLFGDVRGKSVADLCAAPGGKTAQLALAGAKCDRRRPLARAPQPPARESCAAFSRRRDRRRRRHGMAGGPFDAVLLDAPCSSTGTIRRHPDIPWLKNEADIPVLTSMQQRLLDRAVDLLKPGATFIYCVCSLEPEEGENQIAALLARDPRVERNPISAQDVFGHAEFVTTDGDLRTLPLHLPDPDPRWAGLDGFYAARLTRKVV